MFVVQRLKDVQKIKGLTMDTVLLQFWLAGLTGLAESISSSQKLLWKSLVLVKVLRDIALVRLSQRVSLIGSRGSGYSSRNHMAS
jgi:hypothetical protein